MSEIEAYREPERGITLATDVAVQRLVDWAAAADAAMHVAETLSRSSFVPESFRGKPGEATAAILAGLEVGLQPMAALRSFDVIQGQAAPRAVTLRAILQGQGHEIELVESTGTRCKMRGRRRGSHTWQEVTWTIDRAKQLKLTSKHNWQNQPQAMLVARATSEIARLVASDAILGIAYTSEELADGAGPGVEIAVAATADPSTAESAAPTGTKRMSRRKAPTPEPADDSDVADAEVVDQDSVTDAQIKKMVVVFKSAGITDRKDRIDYISATIGREVESSKDITKAEASTVIDALEVLEQDLANEADEYADTLPTGEDAS